MFNNNHIAVHEVRYANSQQDSLIVLFSDQREEKPQVQEMEVEVRKGDAYYEAVRKKGWTKKKIVDATALYKLNSVRAIDQIVEAKLQVKLRELALQWKKIDQQKKQIELSKKEKWNEIDKGYKEVAVQREKLEVSKKQKQKEIDEQRKQIELSKNENWKEIDKGYKQLSELKKQTELAKQEKWQEIDAETKRRYDKLENQLKDVERFKNKQKQKEKELVQAELKMAEEVQEKFEQQYQTKIQEMISDTFERNQDPDDVFKFKLALFEVNTIAKCPREFKLRLRKARSIVQCYAIVAELYEFLEDDNST